MKTVLIFLLLSLSLGLNAQIKGIDFSEAIDYPKGNANFERLYYVFIEKDSIRSYLLSFPKTPIGVKHAFEKMQDLLDRNGLTEKDIYQDKSYLPERYKDLTKYTDISEACRSGEAEIGKYYDFNHFIVALVINFDDCAIYFLHNNP